MKICKKLMLDSYNLEISLFQSKKNIQNILQEREIPMEMTMERLIIIKSKMLSLDMDFYISFQFEGESMVAVSMSPEGYLEGQCLHERYREIQKALENKLGRSKNVVQAVYNYLNPDGSSVHWSDGDVQISHVLQDRFGMEEKVTIDLSKSKLVQLVRIINEILVCINQEEQNIRMGQNSCWTMGQLQEVVFPEVSELLDEKRRQIVEITPQIKVLFVLTKKDSGEIAWDMVSKRLGLTPTKAEGPRLSKGKMSNPSAEDLKGITVLPAPEPPYPFMIHAFWSFELPKKSGWDLEQPLHQMELLLAGKEQEVQDICKEFDLDAELILQIYAESNNMPVCTLSAESISFWNKIGAAVTFDFCL